eukprot:1136282-Pelagomonas_calceolata.AAC.2
MSRHVLAQHTRALPGDTAIATPPVSKVRQSSQMLPDQGHIHLVKVEYCGDTQPKSQLEASNQQDRDLCQIFQAPQLKSPSTPFCAVWVGISAHGGVHPTHYGAP